MAMTDKISLQRPFPELQNSFPELRKAFPPNQ